VILRIILKKNCTDPKNHKISLTGKKREINTSDENIENLIGKINNAINNGKLVIREPVFRTCENFTIAKKGQRTEEILERMIAKVWKKENNNNLEIAHQFPLNKNNRREDIDIVLYEEKNGEKTIKGIVELKYNSNTPLYGIIELIKNYLIINLIVEKYKEEYKINIDKEIELILLAPKFFYESCGNDYLKSIKQIYDFLKNIGYPIYIKYLDITEEEVKEAIKIIRDKDGKEQIKGISDVGDIKEKLQFDKWKDYPLH